MLKFFVLRLVGYPILFSFLWYFVFQKYPDFFLCELVLEGISIFTSDWKLLSEIDINMFVIPFGLAFGYVYATISTVVKVREFKGVICVVLFLLKVVLTIILTTSFGIYLFVLELLLLPISIFMFNKLKNYRSNKKKKVTQLTEEELLLKVNSLLNQIKNA